MGERKRERKTLTMERVRLLCARGETEKREGAAAR